jgi:proteasome lid subunit RPN8/RPN11
MTLSIHPEIRQAMLTHAYNCHPEESCGLLAGDESGAIRMAYPLTNVLRSRTNYTIDPREHFRALKHAERQGWDIVGVFHSHPHSEAFPSPTDVRLAPEPDWLYVLVGMEQIDRPDVRGFHIRQGLINEIPIQFTENGRKRP